jgi:hypothetical protein
VYNFTLDIDSGTYGHGSEVGDIECTANTGVLPKPGTRDQMKRHASAKVEYSRRAAAVQVPHAVGHEWRYSEPKSRLRTIGGAG